MPTIISGDGTITGLTSTGISAAQTVSASNITTGTLPFAQLPAGSVLQVVNASNSTNNTNGTNTYTDTSLTATITPKYATSKIWVFAVNNGVKKLTNNTYGGFQLLRNSTVIGTIEGVGSTNSTANVGGFSPTFNYLDSPATTSAITYKTQFCSLNNTNVIYVNDYASAGTSSYITLIEIAQ